MNPLYTAYAAAHEMTPIEILKADEENWPGGMMTGFFLWMADMRRKFYMVHPKAFLDRFLISDYDAWEEFCKNPENWSN